MSIMANKNYLARLPTWISHWLGYRNGPPKKQPEYIVYLWSFVAAFCGLAVIQAIFGHTNYFVHKHNVVPIVASYGASAVLCYGAIEAPFSQPRALIFGHFFSALIGICIAKLFHLLPTEERYNSLEWLAASLSTAIAIFVMQITKTTHPPAGATALLPATNPQIFAMSWYFLPVVLLSSMLVLVTALLINNIQRRYPVFWIAPAPPAPPPAVKPTPIQEDPESGNQSAADNSKVESS